MADGVAGWEGAPVSDSLLASVIAEELNEYLRSRAADVASPVYAVSLWSNPDYAELGVSIGTEEPYLRRPTKVGIGSRCPDLD